MVKKPWGKMTVKELDSELKRAKKETAIIEKHMKKWNMLDDTKPKPKKPFKKK